eukprot:Gb_03976 [translate_table: standard]
MFITAGYPLGIEQISVFCISLWVLILRSSVPKMNLDDVFEQKDELAKSMENELEKAMTNYGFEIVQTLIVDIDPDETVKRAMNEINAAARMRLATCEKAEAEKILQIKRAEAEAESKYLSGLGIARQRQAIVDGLRDSVLAFSGNVPGTTAKDVMDMVLVTQYFDTMKEIGASSKSSSVFIPHGPGAVRDITHQIRDDGYVGNICVIAVTICFLSGNLQNKRFCLHCNVLQYNNVIGDLSQMTRLIGLTCRSLVYSENQRIIKTKSSIVSSPDGLPLLSTLKQEQQNHNQDTKEEEKAESGKFELGSQNLKARRSSSGRGQKWVKVEWGSQEPKVNVKNQRLEDSRIVACRPLQGHFCDLLLGDNFLFQKGQ